MKIVNTIFMAVFFYILGLNTHNAVWKWLDQSRRSKDCLPSFVSAVPDTLVKSLTLIDPGFIDSMRATRGPDLSHPHRTIHEPGGVKKKSIDKSSAYKPDDHRTEGEIRSYEVPGVAVYFMDTTRFTFKPVAEENHLTDSMYRQWDIEECLMRRRMKRDSIIQTQ